MAWADIPASHRGTHLLCHSDLETFPDKTLDVAAQSVEWDTGRHEVVICERIDV